jgi:glycosyltransferase involved in cell wall biosynthesis
MRFFWAGGAKMRIDRLCDALNKSVSLYRIGVSPTEQDEQARNGMHVNAAVNESNSEPFDLYYGANAAQLLMSQLEDLNIDLVIASDLNVARYALNAQDAIGVPFILDMHNIESRLRAELLSAYGHLPQYDSLDGDGVRRVAGFERRVVERAWQVWCCTPDDIDVVRRMFPEQDLDIAYVPNVVTVDGIAPTVPESSPTVPRVVFAGSLDYLPNWEAAMEVVRDIKPAVSALGREFSFEIWGKSPDGVLAELASASQVALHADFPVGVVPCRGAVSLAPMRVARGSRLKVLECFSEGSPLISTALGVSGIDARPGVHYIEAESVDDFASAICSLAENANLYRSLIRAAKDLVLSAYSQGVLDSRISSIVKAWGI